PRAPLDSLDSSEIHRELETILKSATFAASQRSSQFLGYIVERSLEGKGADLKEYAIALEVFDRPPSFDPRIDTIVRVQARRLRNRLSEYYAGEGLTDSIVIELPKGAYAPVFRPAGRGGETGLGALYSAV